jgi:hypothetical protein
MAGTCTGTTSTELFEYGICTESSDVRAHVSVCDRTVYVFETKNGIRAIEEHDPPIVTATQPGAKGPTASGWLVRFEWVSDLRRLKFYSWPSWGMFTSSLSTSEKGALAVRCVIDIMKIGRFPLWFDAAEADQPEIQIQGVDILVFANKKIQVKCDYRAGDTGNLFLQKSERNPFGRH